MANVSFNAFIQGTMLQFAASNNTQPDELARELAKELAKGMAITAAGFCGACVADRGASLA